MATAKKASVAAKIRGVLTLNPNAKVSVIANKFNVSPAYVYQVKGKAAKTPKQQWKITDIVTSKEPLFGHKNLEAPVPLLTNTDAMLAERGSRYGTFAEHAKVTQLLKVCIHGHAKQHGKELTAAQAEALDMIAHKIGRIVNGDPSYVDSWRDIEGYAKLVADELETGKQV